MLLYDIHTITRSHDHTHITPHITFNRSFREVSRACQASYHSSLCFSTSVSISLLLDQRVDLSASRPACRSPTAKSTHHHTNSNERRRNEGESTRSLLYAPLEPPLLMGQEKTDKNLAKAPLGARGAVRCEPPYWRASRLFPQSPRRLRSLALSVGRAAASPSRSLSHVTARVISLSNPSLLWLRGRCSGVDCERSISHHAVVAEYDQPSPLSPSLNSLRPSLAL